TRLRLPVQIPARVIETPLTSEVRIPRGADRSTDRWLPEVPRTTVAWPPPTCLNPTAVPRYSSTWRCAMADSMDEVLHWRGVRDRVIRLEKTNEAVKSRERLVFGLYVVLVILGWLVWPGKTL